MKKAFLLNFVIAILITYSPVSQDSTMIVESEAVSTYRSIDPDPY